jgi:hypothetical protein
MLAPSLAPSLAPLALLALLAPLAVSSGNLLLFSRFK